MDNQSSSQNPVTQLLTTVSDIFVASVLFFACCIPIVTIGPSATALYAVMLKMENGENDGVVSSFFKSFRENFKQALLISVILLLVVAFLAVDIYFFLSGILNAPMLLQLIIWVALLIPVCAIGYVFPMIARFEVKTRRTLVNALIITVTHIPHSIAMLLVNMLPLIILILSPTLFSQTLILWPFFGFGLQAKMNAKILHPIFQKLFPKEQEETMTEDAANE